MTMCGCGSMDCDICFGWVPPPLTISVPMSHPKLNELVEAAVITKPNLFEGLPTPIAISHMTFGGTVETLKMNKTKLIEWLTVRDGGRQMTTVFRPGVEPVEHTWRLEITLDGRIWTWLAENEGEVYDKAVDELASHAGQMLSMLK